MLWPYTPLSSPQTVGTLLVRMVAAEDASTPARHRPEMALSSLKRRSQVLLSSSPLYLQEPYASSF